MSGQLLALVIILAVASAAVGAGAAILLRPASDAPEPASAAAVAVTVPSAPEQTSASDQQQGRQSAEPGEDVTATVQRPSSPAAAEAQSSQAADSEDSQTTDTAQRASTQENRAEANQAAETSQATVDATPIDPKPHVAAVITPDLITQGEAAAITVGSSEASAIAATVDGRSWSLSKTSAGQWWGLIAIPRDADSGVTNVVIDIYGAGGVWLRSLTASLVVLASTAPFEEIVLGGTGAPADPAEVERDIAVRFAEHTAVSGPPRWTGPWILPVEGEVTGVFGSFRSYDGVHSDEWHHGHDIAAQHGDPIVAPAPGAVVWTGELILHGMGVIIDHGGGVYSGYWHMSLIAVREGMDLVAGDWLGNIGTTGLSTGPHLHWEVIVQGVDVDPVQWTGADRPPLPSVVDPAAEDETPAADTLEQ